jgi:hypothetical protein
VKKNFKEISVAIVRVKRLKREMKTYGENVRAFGWRIIIL